MSANEATAEELWHWLASCLDCGEPHEFQPAHNCCGKCPHGGFPSWASKVDGHSYRTREIRPSNLADLRVQFERSRARA